LRFVSLLRLAPCAGGLSFPAGASIPARFAAPLFLIAAFCLGLSACGSGNNERLGERVIPLGQPVPKGGGFYQIGKPYQVGDLTYTTREDPGYDRVGNASWYGELFHGRRTANGEIYDMDSLSAAHPTLPLPVYARVTNLNNGRTIVVRINDRGPDARDRIIDLSRRSAELLGFRNNGTATVRVKYLGRAPLNGDDSYERKYLASQSWMQVASKGKSKGDVLATSSTLPAENPENLALAWNQAAPRASAPPGPASPPALAAQKATTKGVAAPAPNLRTATAAPPPQSTGSLAPASKPKPQSGGAIIQAGSFKNKENADRARMTLAAIGSVEVTPFDVGGNVYYRVRVGPFSATPETKTALAKVKSAGFQGAKIVGGN
jgi:rare lipoprotein A